MDMESESIPVETEDDVGSDSNTIDMEIVEEGGFINVREGRNREPTTKKVLVNTSITVLGKLVGSVKKQIQSLNVADGDKSFGRFCSRLEKTIDVLRITIVQDGFPERDAVIQILFTAIRKAHSLVSSQRRNEQERNVLTRLMARVTSFDPPLFSPSQLQALEIDLSSLLKSPADSSIDGINNTREQILVEHADNNPMTGEMDRGLTTIPSNQPDDRSPEQNSRLDLSPKTSVLPLLDLRKNHDADSLPSPPRESSAPLSLEKVASSEYVLIKPKLPLPLPSTEEDLAMYPCETDAVRAVSDDQQKFEQNEFLPSERLPSPTPSGDMADNGVNREVSGSISEHTAVLDISVPRQSLVSSDRDMLTSERLPSPIPEEGDSADNGVNGEVSCSISEHAAVLNSSIPSQSLVSAASDRGILMSESLPSPSPSEEGDAADNGVNREVSNYISENTAVLNSSVPRQSPFSSASDRDMLTNERLQSPTPSEEDDMTDNGVNGEVSGSISEHTAVLNSSIPSQSLVSSASDKDVSMKERLQSPTPSEEGNAEDSGANGEVSISIIEHTAVVNVLVLSQPLAPSASDRDMLTNERHQSPTPSEEADMADNGVNGEVSGSISEHTAVLNSSIPSQSLVSSASDRDVLVKERLQSPTPSEERDAEDSGANGAVSISIIKHTAVVNVLVPSQPLAPSASDRDMLTNERHQSPTPSEEGDTADNGVNGGVSSSISVHTAVLNSSIPSQSLVSCASDRDVLMIEMLQSPTPSEEGDAEDSGANGEVSISIIEHTAVVNVSVPSQPLAPSAIDRDMLTNESLQSPTPSEEGDTADNGVNGEVSSSISVHTAVLNSSIPSQSLVSCASDRDVLMNEVLRSPTPSEEGDAEDSAANGEVSISIIEHTAVVNVSVPSQSLAPSASDRDMLTNERLQCSSSSEEGDTADNGEVSISISEHTAAHNNLVPRQSLVSSASDGDMLTTQEESSIHRHVEPAIKSQCETDAVRAVSDDQQKFGKSESLTRERLSNPTPDEEGDTADDGVNGEISSSIGEHTAALNSSVPRQPLVSSASDTDMLTAQEESRIHTREEPAIKSQNSALKSKSRDLGLRLASSGVAKRDINEHSSEPHGGVVSMQKQEMVDEILSDYPAVKRQRIESTSSVDACYLHTDGCLEDTGTGTPDPRNMEHGVSVNAPDATAPAQDKFQSMGRRTDMIQPVSGLNTLPVMSQSTKQPVEEFSAALSLSSLLRDIVVNPSIWMNILITEYAKSSESIEDSVKVRMNPRDPRRMLHNSALLKGVNTGSDQSKATPSPSSIADMVNLHKLWSSSSPELFDIAIQITEDLNNIADTVSVSQASMPSPITPQSSLIQHPSHGPQSVINATNSAIVNYDSLKNVSESASAEEITASPRSTEGNAWSDFDRLLEAFDNVQKAVILIERAKRLEEQKKMFAQRKLSLVLDLDHTLLNSASFHVIDRQHNEILRKKEEQDREKPRRHLFCLQHMGMWTKLRPGIWNFLEKASKLYELHVYTMGNKSYATEMAKLLDPSGELFAGRVFARCDDSDPFDGNDRVHKSKDLEGVLGMETNIVIMDDTVQVWPHNRPNLIVAERYTYFPGSRHPFGLQGPSLLEVDRDERPEHGTLASFLGVIERIHESFFAHEPLDEADVRDILAFEQRKVLSGCRIVFSRVFPIAEANPHNHPLWKKAEQFGASCTTQIDKHVTHVVAVTLGTDKVNWAVAKGKFVVCPGWVEASALLYRKANESDFAVK